MPGNDAVRPESPRPDALRRLGVLKKRFEGMGLEPVEIPGGGALVVTLALSKEPFPTSRGKREIQAARFYTVGHDRIKFCSPRAFAFLPLLRVLDCEKPIEIEARLREAWAQWSERQSEAHHWIRELGIDPDAAGGLPLCRFSLGLEETDAYATVLEPGRIILPSRGPLAGLPLTRAEDRVYRTRAVETGIDLELDITAQLERLARAQRRDDERKPRLSEPTQREPRRAPVLLVGTKVAAAEAFHQSMRLRHLEPELVRGLSEAVEHFRRRTYDAVIVEARLDRADGVELIPALRALPGILELPVAVLDERAGSNRRAQAKEAGATAYLAGGVEAANVAPAVHHMVNAGARRRFTRYDDSLSISWDASAHPAVATSLSRGGLFVRTHGALPETLFSVHVPDGPDGPFTMQVELDPVHRNVDPHAGPDGVGSRFRSFSDGDEERWIAYLDHLHAGTSR